MIARVAESGKAETVADLGRDGDTAVVLPLPVSAGGPAGSLVLGISRFRELNEQYRVFLDMVAVRVSTALSDAQAYEAERRRAAELAELDAAKSRFFENVSHEFRTPLTLLLGPLQTLLDEHAAALPPAQVDAVAAARRAALRLQRLVDMLLDVARGDAGRLDAHTEPTDIVAVTREAAELFRDAADRAGLALLVDVDNVPTRYVATDRAMWTHIVLNLLSNAMKFTPEGSVAVSLRGDGANLVLRVADTGTGIAEAERGKIFDRFYQIGDRSGRSREGSGIGLSLVAQFVAALGGSVSVDAVAPHGSVFTVTVPAVPSAQPAHAPRTTSWRPPVRRTWGRPRRGGPSRPPAPDRARGNRACSSSRTTRTCVTISSTCSPRRVGTSTSPPTPSPRSSGSGRRFPTCSSATSCCPDVAGCRCCRTCGATNGWRGCR